MVICSRETNIGPTPGFSRDADPTPGFIGDADPIPGFSRDADPAPGFSGDGIRLCLLFCGEFPAVIAEDPKFV